MDNYLLFIFGMTAIVAAYLLISSAIQQDRNNNTAFIQTQAQHDALHEINKILERPAASVTEITEISKIVVEVARVSDALIMARALIEEYEANNGEQNKKERL